MTYEEDPTEYYDPTMDGTMNDDGTYAAGEYTLLKSPKGRTANLKKSGGPTRKSGNPFRNGGKKSSRRHFKKRN